MAKCSAAKIVIGFQVREWSNVDLSSFSTKSNPIIWDIFDNMVDELDIITSGSYEDSEEDVIVGMLVHEVYNQPEVLDTTKLLKDIESVNIKFKEKFGVDGKVYMGAYEY